MDTSPAQCSSCDAWTRAVLLFRECCRRSAGGSSAHIFRRRHTRRCAALRGGIALPIKTSIPAAIIPSTIRATFLLGARNWEAIVQPQPARSHSTPLSSQFSRPACEDTIPRGTKRPSDHQRVENQKLRCVDPRPDLRTPTRALPWHGARVAYRVSLDARVNLGTVPDRQAHGLPAAPEKDVALRTISATLLHLAAHG